MRLLGVFVVLAGCHSGSTATPDASFDGSGGAGSGSGQGLGLFVAWEANPVVPGTLTDDTTVTEVDFQLKSFQLLSDAGNATRSKYQLTWSAATEPSEEEFPDAPAGTYSKVEIDLGGSLAAYAYSIQGTWRDHDNGDAITPFKITDLMPLTVSVDCDKTLVAAGSTEVAVRLDLRDAIGDIDFQKLEPNGPLLVLDNGNPDQLKPFRDRLLKSFKIEN